MLRHCAVLRERRFPLRVPCLRIPAPLMVLSYSAWRTIRKGRASSAKSDTCSSQSSMPSMPPRSPSGWSARARFDSYGRLLQLRDDVSSAKPEDLPSLFEQTHHLGALRAQRGRSIVGSVDRATPYFGHMRLEETQRPGTYSAEAGPRRRRDVLVGFLLVRRWRCTDCRLAQRTPQLPLLSVRRG